MVLPRSFYERPVLDVARDCIGMVLVRRTPEGITSGRIVESEAYRGPEDLAAHSAGGRRTQRTEAMFGPPGHAYMFLLYGMHWAFNIVVAKEGEPHAVLIRAIEPVAGVELMARRRSVDPSKRELTNGPGKVCAALGLTKAAYGLDLCARAESVAASQARDEELYLTWGPAVATGRSPRINVDYAGAWAARPWRFYERGNRYVSVKPRD
jgi:DNA-3-methyladenine glycosylase